MAPGPSVNDPFDALLADTEHFRQVFDFGPGRPEPSYLQHLILSEFGFRPGTSEDRSMSSHII